MDLNEGEHEGDLMAKKARDYKKEYRDNQSSEARKNYRVGLKQDRREAGFINPKTGKSNGKGKGIDMAHSEFYGKGKVTQMPSSENKSRQPKRKKRTKTA
jgi:hypothetical protein